MSSNNDSHTLEFHYDVSASAVLKPLSMRLTFDSDIMSIRIHSVNSVSLPHVQVPHYKSTDPLYRVEALAARANARLIWRPVLLGAIYRATDAPQGAAGSASDVFNPTKKVVSAQTFLRTLKRFHIPHNQPPVHPLKTTSPLRLLYHVNESQRPQLTHALFRAYWVEGKDVSSKAVLQEIVQKSGISGAQDLLQAIEKGKHEGEHERNELAKATDLAVKRGSPGVPGFWIEDEVWTNSQGERKQGRLYWGQDRMHFVEAVLNALNKGSSTDGIITISRSLYDLMPRCSPQLKIGTGEQVKLEFWYDFSSPWAFLGWATLARLQRQFGTQLKIEMKPFLLGILFRE
jgi:2-hydroxychromene-2-carboxylate isomerase